MAAGAKMLLFRSGVVGLYDLDGDYGTAHLGARRPACRLSCIPAGGLALMPEGSAGCTCPFPLQGTVVMAPVRDRRMYGIYSKAGPTSPVKHWRINFAAPGDWRDGKGRLWLAYPRPRLGLIPTLIYSDRLIFDFKLRLSPRRGIGVRVRKPHPGADDASVVAATGLVGVAGVSIPVGGKAEGPYEVRLTFGGQAKSVCHVTLQQKRVAEGLTIPGGPGRPTIARFMGIPIAGSLSIGLETVAGRPVLAGVEILAETP
jgi:hypothetical protein